jgi:hypothetical protein
MSANLQQGGKISKVREANFFSNGFQPYGTCTGNVDVDESSQESLGNYL